MQSAPRRLCASPPCCCCGGSPGDLPPPAPAPAPGALPHGSLAARPDRARVCFCSSQGFWRPWLLAPGALCSPHHETTEEPAKLTQYTHPVRLFWPKSRCFDYLYQEAEALLRNFPVQATISFYEESESEESDDQEQDSEAEVDD